MKRIILCCLSVILMLTALVPLSVSASSSQKLTFSMTDAEGIQGENVTVYVEMSANSGINAFMLSVNYDTDQLELVKAENVDLECIFSPVKGNPLLEDSPFTLSWVDVDQHLTEKTTLAKLTFKIKETATPGGCFISVSYNQNTILNVTGPNEYESPSYSRSTGYVRILCNHVFGAYTYRSSSVHEKKCSKCGKNELAYHTWDSGKVTKPATHTETGVRTYTCADCGATQTVQIPTIQGHGFGEWVSISTTQHRRSCSCGESEVASHQWDNGKITTPATHSQKGVRTYTCTDCGETKTASVPTISQHTYDGDWQYNYEKHWKECVCGQKGSTAFHTYSAWVITKQATKQETGIKERTCTVCSYKEAVVIDRVAETAPVTTPNAPVTTPNKPVTTPNAPVTTPNKPVTTPNAPVTTPNKPVTDVPAIDVPAIDVPVTDVPATDVPATDVPVTDVPVTDVPVTDVPVTDAPATDVPATDVPVTDAPATDAPATDAPATDVPATDVPATDVPATDVPATDAPVIDVPTTDTPKTDASDTTTATPVTTTYAAVTTDQTSEGLSSLLSDQWQIIVIGALALIAVIIVIIIVIVRKKKDDQSE